MYKSLSVHADETAEGRRRFATSLEGEVAMNEPRVREIADELGVALALARAKLRELGEFALSSSAQLSPPVAHKLRAALEADLLNDSAMEGEREASSGQVGERGMSADQRKIAESGAIDGGAELKRELDRLSLDPPMRLGDEPVP